jgi:uncharacterized protein (TIGR00645 family)
MVNFVQKLRVFVRTRLSSPIDDILVAMLNFVDLSLRPNLVLIVTLVAGHDRVDPLLSARWGDRPVWVAPDFRAIKPKLIGVLAAIAAVATLESAMHTGTLAAATVVWQLAIVLWLGALAVLPAARDRLDMESSKE